MIVPESPSSSQGEAAPYEEDWPEPSEELGAMAVESPLKVQTPRSPAAPLADLDRSASCDEVVAATSEGPADPPAPRSSVSEALESAAMDVAPEPSPAACPPLPTAASTDPPPPPAAAAAAEAPAALPPPAASPAPAPQAPPTTASSSSVRPHPSGLQISQRREAYLRRYLKDQYPIQLQASINEFLTHGRFQPFSKGDYVEVRARLQPGECKMGGLGHIRKVYTDHVHMYDVKYAIGGLDRMVDGNFIISRREDDSKHQRKSSQRCTGCGAFQHECRCVRVVRRRAAQTAVADGASAAASSSGAAAQRRPSLKRPRPNDKGLPDSLSRLGQEERRPEAAAKSRRSRVDDSSSSSSSSGEESDDSVDVMLAKARMPSRRAMAVDGSSSSNEGGDEEDDDEGVEGDGARGAFHALMRNRRPLVLWSEDEEEEDKAGEEDEAPPPPQEDDEEEGPAKDGARRAEGGQEEKEEESVEVRTLAEQEAQRLVRTAVRADYGRRAGAADRGFIRGEGERNAERLPMEVSQIISRKRLKEVERQDMPAKITELLGECWPKLKEYKRHLRSGIKKVEKVLKELQGRKLKPAEVNGLVAKAESRLVALEEEMRRFTWQTDDVLNWCMKKVRAADEDRCSPKVDAFFLKHGEVDQAAKTYIKQAREELDQAGGGHVELSTDEEEGRSADEDEEEEEEGEEEAEEEEEEEDDDEVLLVEMTGASGGAGGDSRAKKRMREQGAGRKRRPGSGGSAGRTRRADGSHSRAGSRGRGGGQGVDRTLDGFIVDDLRQPRRKKRHVSGEGGGRAATESRARRQPGMAGSSGEQGREALSSSSLRGADRGVSGRRRAGGLVVVSDEGEEESGGADEEEAFPLTDDEQQSQGSGRGGSSSSSSVPQLAPLDGDLEAALSSKDSVTWPLGLREADLWPAEPSSADGDVMILGLAGQLRSSWMLQQPTAFLPTVLLPSLLARFSLLSCSSRPSAVDLSSVKSAMACITQHLQLYAYRYDAAQLCELGESLRRFGIEADRCYCPHGLLLAPASKPGSTEGRSLESQHVEGLAPLLYSSLLDWFSIITYLEQQRGPQATASPSSRFLPHLSVYVLHHLTAASLRNPSLLSLRLPSRDMEDSAPYFHRLSSPVPSLWCSLFRSLTRAGRAASFWPQLLQVLHCQGAAPADWLGKKARQALANETLAQLTESEAAAASSGGPAAMDMARAERWWRLLFELVRLEVMLPQLPSFRLNGGQEVAQLTGGAEAGAARWTIVEMLLRTSPLDVDLLESGGQRQAQQASQARSCWSERYGSTVCPHRYTMLLIHRLRTLISAWGPPVDLTARVWEALLRRSSARLAAKPDRAASEASRTFALGPRPASSSAWRWFRDAVRSGLLDQGGPGQSWSAARAMLWRMADAQLCSLEPYFFLPPPHLLAELSSGAEAMRQLVSRGCDEVLLLSSLLLERHLGCMATPDLRRSFLSGLMSRLDSIGGLTQLLGLHNLAMAVLALHHHGQAEQKVLVNFWRKLKAAANQGRTDTSGHFERGLALSVQFLAQIGPSAELQPDFTHVGSFFDSLMSWFDLTGRTTQEMEALAAKQLAPPVRYPPTLRWSLLLGLVVCLQALRRFPQCASSSASLPSTLSRLLVQYKDLDNATLGLLLWSYRRLCPLPATAPLGAGCQLMARLPVLSSSAADGAAAAPDAAVAVTRWAPAPGLLAALNTLAREAWMGPSALTDVSPDSLSLTLHGLAAIRALASALALSQATGQSPVPDCLLLRSSLDSKASSYADKAPGALQLRLFAPCFYDSYLAYQLPASYALLEGRGWDVLAAWLGLTVELSAIMDSQRGNAAESIWLETKPLRHLQARYWQLTSRLSACLSRLPDDEGAGLLSFTKLGQEVPTPRAQQPSPDRDLTLRLALLAHVFVSVAQVLRRLQSNMQRRNLFKQRVARALGLLGGSLRLYAPAGQQHGMSVRTREFGYSVMSLLLRLCGDVMQDKLLEDLVPQLFAPFFLPPSSPPGAPSEADLSIQLVPAADRLGDVVRCLAQVNYSKPAIVSWMRQLSQTGMFVPAAPRSLQARALRSLCHGLWHACACHPWADEPSISGAQSAMRELVQLNAGAALVREIETQAQQRLDAFRWRFLFELDVNQALEPALTAERMARTSRIVHFLRLFFSSRCTCGRTAPSACPSNDVFPVLAPMAYVLLLTLQPGSPLSQPLVESLWCLVDALMGCRLSATTTVASWGRRSSAPAEPLGGRSKDATKQGLRVVMRRWLDLVALIGAARVMGGEDERGVDLVAALDEARRRFVTQLEEVVRLRSTDQSTVSRHVWGSVSVKRHWREVLLGVEVAVGGGQRQAEEMEALIEVKRTLLAAAEPHQAADQEDCVFSRTADDWLRRCVT